jgi:hypothetical protein
MILRLGLILLLSNGTPSTAFQIHQPYNIRSNSQSTLLNLSTKATEKPPSVPDFSSSTKPIDESAIFADEDSTAAAARESSWQESLELLLAPDTSVAERQILLSDLLNSGDKIQDSVRTALRERKVSGDHVISFYGLIRACILN